MEIRKSISVIVPNYNGIHLLQEYLPYTYEAVKNAGIIFEIIVADDCSTDGSIEFIRSEYPEIILIVNSENKGFSYACNRGIEAAQYELILLLNADVKLAPDYFEHQWKFFLAWDTFGVMGRIIDMENDRILNAACVSKFNSLNLETDYFYYTDDDSNRLLTFYLSGLNALIDTAKLKQMGGFSELFSQFYRQDMELSIRAWRLNWKCYYEHKAVCRRDVSASTKNNETEKSVKSVYYCNKFYLHALHLNGLALTAWYFQTTIINLLPKLLTGQTWAWKSYKELYGNRTIIKQYKKKIEILMDENDSETTIFIVVKKIRNSVKNKKIFRFKS